MIRAPWSGPGSHRNNLVRLTLVSLAVTALTAVSLASAYADDGCDQSEAVACIPLPSDTSAPTAGASTSGALTLPAASAAPAAASAAARPCPLSTCCLPLAGAVTGEAPLSAAPYVPALCSPAPPPPSAWCPPVLPALAAVPAAAAVAVPVSAPVPVPVSCSPYRGIYATINLGNAADVRALRTLSTTGLSAYWRRDALAQIEDQVAQLELAGVSANTRLYSIRVEDSSISYVNRTAKVHTMEHWLYQQRSLDDGSIQLSQDEWVANEYDLTFMNNSWYITYNSATQTDGPSPAFLPGA